MSHSRLAASASGRWIRCPGSIAYIEFLKKENKIPSDNFSGPAARLGTAVHKLIEHCVETEIHPSWLSKGNIKSILSHEEDTKGIEIDDKALQGAVTCYERVELIRPEFDELFAEKKYDLSFLYDIDVGGTCDISGFKENGLLGIEDYKNGRTVVEVEDNYQLYIYALGAYHNENEWYNFKSVRATIIQPNASHKEGRIRCDTYSIDHLRRWEEKKLAPAIDLIAKDTATLIPGPVQCTWCDARHLCEANAKQSLHMAQIDFQNVALPKAELPSPQSLSEDQLCFILDNKARLMQFFSKCEEYAFKSAEKKSTFGSYVLEDKRGNRKYLEEKKVKSALRKSKVRIKDCMITPEPHMMTITQLESYLKTDKKWEKDKIIEFMADITERPITGKQLVKAIDTAERDFGKVKKLRKKRK